MNLEVKINLHNIKQSNFAWDFVFLRSAGRMLCCYKLLQRSLEGQNNNFTGRQVGHSQSEILLTLQVHCSLCGSSCHLNSIRIGIMALSELNTGELPLHLIYMRED